MAIYLIDYENTGVKGLYGIEKLKEDDLVVIFYGPKTGAVPFDEHVRISTSASHVEYIKTTKTAKNYLDFQLTTYLGYLIAQTVVRDFKIVSKDSGYDSVIDFWGKKGIRIKRLENVAGEAKAATSEKKASSGKNASAKNAAVGKKATTGKNSTSEKIATTGKNTTSEKSVTTGKNTTSKQNSTSGKKTNTSEKKTSEKTDTEKLDDVELINAENIQEEENTTRVENDVNSSKDNNAEEKKAKTVPESIRKKIRAALKAENPHAGVYRAIYACMIDSTDKQSFNTALVRQFTQEMGNKYYKAVVPAFSEWLKHS